MKRFISLGAAIMMGTVLSKEQNHKHGEKKAVAKAEKINIEEAIHVAKKDSIEEHDIFVDHNDQQISEASYSNYQSPETSKETMQKEETA